MAAPPPPRRGDALLRSSSPTAAAPAAAPPPWPAPPEQQQQAGASARRALAAVLLCVLVPTLVIVASVATVGGGSASPGAAAGLGGGSLVVPLPPAAMSWPFADSLAEFAAGQPVLSSAGPVAFGAGPYPGTRALVLNNTAGVDVWTWASYLAAPAAAPLATARGFSFSVWASAAAAGGPTQGGVYLDLYDTAGRSYNFLGAGAGYWASNGASLAFGAAAARGGAPGTWFLSSGTYSTLGLDVYLDLYLNGTAAGRWTVAAGFTVAAVMVGRTSYCLCGAFSGSLASLRLYASPLSAAQHGALFAAGAPLAPPAPPPAPPAPPPAPPSVNPFPGSSPPRPLLNVAFASDGGAEEVVISAAAALCPNPVAGAYGQDLAAFAYRAADGAVALVAPSGGNYRAVRRPGSSAFVMDCGAAPPLAYAPDFPVETAWPALYKGLAACQVPLQYGAWAMPDVLTLNSGTVYGTAQTLTCTNGSLASLTTNTAGVVSADGGASYAFAAGPDPAPGMLTSPSLATLNGQGGTYWTTQSPLDTATWYVFSQQVVEPGSSWPGLLMIPWRSRNISDTNSWRAWDGSGFTVAATDPYTTTAAGPPSPPPAAGRRRAAVPTTPVRGQVVWSEVAGGCWLLVGAYGPGPLSQWAYSTSADLVTWSATVDLVAFNWEPQLAFPGYFYVSIIDIDWEGNVGNNFISSGPNPYLY